MHIFLPEHVRHLYFIDYMALALKIMGHNITQNFVSMYLTRQCKSGATDQVFGDQSLKNKKLYTYAKNYDSKEFKTCH